jgi:8-oxo-dGTP diphosphatase
METASLSAVSQINWEQWQPEQRATLLFVIRNGNMLLIHKKRGLGAGNINGPGGRLEKGETALACAIRETREELGIRALNVRECGQLHFQFRSGLSIHVTVFSASDCEGAPYETEEAIPHWVPVDKIPYDKMWQDDAYWLPVMLAGTPFKGYFIFDESRMVDHRVDVENGAWR